jgi:hypothetical protein
MSAEVRKPLNKRLYDASRLIGAPPVPQRELPKQAADMGYHACGYSIDERGVIDETLRAEYSSRVTTIEPANQMSDDPEMGVASLIRPPTPDQMRSASSLLPQLSISTPSSAHNPYSDRPPVTAIVQPLLNPSTGQRTLAEYLARQRAQINSLPPAQPDKKKRKTRTCAKCQSEKCPGNANRKWCKSACFDCGEKSCRGRNTKQPNRTCKEASWDE